MIFWGLLGMVAPTLFQTKNKSHWSRHIIQYLKQDPLSPDDI